MRATGVGFLYNIGVIGGGLTPFIVLTTIHAVDMTVALGIAGFSIVAAIAAFVLLCFVKETKGHTINQSLDDSRQDNGSRVNSLSDNKLSL